MSSESKDDAIVQEAKDRFEKCESWESRARKLFKDDTRFVEGDSENTYQWDDAIRSARADAMRPCLTINKTRQCCLQIVNDARQNKAQIRITATGDGASYESAQVFEGITRHIEYQSNAMETYEAAAWHQVTGGWGYWRVVTDYVDDNSFDQEIYIRRVADPLSVYLDPDIQEFDGSDARYAFAFRDVPRDQYEKEYPQSEADGVGAPIDGGGDTWNNRDHVRVAEYFRRVQTDERIILLPGGSTATESEIREQTPELWDEIKNHPDLKSRKRKVNKVEWYKIAGSKIIERNVWPGKYIPLVRTIGEETVIDGTLDRKGHVRALKDPQRMYNYQSSSSVEYIAAQSKSPWLVDMDSIEGLETYWSSANTELRAYLPWKRWNAEGRENTKPERNMPPQISNAHIEAMKIAQNEMMMASGQYQSQFGENENAKSGIAIQTRQRQGDNATYHYIDHLAQAIKFTGKILIDLIPKIYDTERVIKIMAENGDQTEVHIDPGFDGAHQMVAPPMNGQPPQPISPDQAKQLQGNPDIAAAIKTIFNPSVGRYEVEADIGPAYATRRQETFAALTQMMGQNAQLVGVAGDLLFRAADFPMADEIAERLKRTIAPNILGEGPPPALQQLQQQAQQQTQHLQGIISQLIKSNAEKDAQLKDKDAEHTVRDYDAETRRLATVSKIDPAALMPVIRQLVSEVLQTPIVPLMGAHAAVDAALQPQPAALPSDPAPDQSAAA